jgi:16S rRNA pseudouridine516 synthase
MRLDRFVSQATGLSRSQARALIRRGEILLDGLPVKDQARQVGGAQRVERAGATLALPGPLYLMLNKPCGLLSATSDSAQQTVLSLLPATLAARLHLVGRLDKATSGLLLLTDDGAWSHRVTSPNHHCAKTYIAQLAEPLVDDAERRLAQGLLLRNETAPLRPASLQRLDALRVQITITEGRYHQVRRMFAALGNRVVALHRQRIGGLTLDERLRPGQWRALTPAERAAVLHCGKMPGADPFGPLPKVQVITE